MDSDVQQHLQRKTAWLLHKHYHRTLTRLPLSLPVLPLYSHPEQSEQSEPSRRERRQQPQNTQGGGHQGSWRRPSAAGELWSWIHYSQNLTELVRGFSFQTAQPAGSVCFEGQRLSIGTGLLTCVPGSRQVPKIYFGQCSGSERLRAAYHSIRLARSPSNPFLLERGCCSTGGQNLCRWTKESSVFGDELESLGSIVISQHDVKRGHLIQWNIS